MTDTAPMSISQLCAAGRYTEVAAELAHIAEGGAKIELTAGLLDLAFECGKLAHLREEFARAGAISLATNKGVFL